MAEDTSKSKYIYLDQMSTEELKQLLYAAALSEDSGEQAMLNHILEVIVAREEQIKDIAPPDMKRVREEFDRLYRDLEEPLYPSEDLEDMSPPSPLRAKKKSLWYTLIAAAVLAVLIAITCVPVLGYSNVVHMVARWTADQFRFCMTGTSSEQKTASHQADEAQIPEEYAELQSAMEQFDAQLIIPDFPDDFKIEHSVLHYSCELNRVNFSIVYQNQDRFFIYTIAQNSKPVLNGYRYEKLHFHAEHHIYGNIECYILPNVQNNTVTWYRGKTEFSIITNMPPSTFEDILKSAYEV